MTTTSENSQTSIWLHSLALFLSVLAASLLIFIVPVWWIEVIRKIIKSFLMDDLGMKSLPATVYSVAAILENPLLMQSHLSMLILVLLLRCIHSYKWANINLNPRSIFCYAFAIVTVFVGSKQAEQFNLGYEKFYPTGKYYGVYLWPFCRQLDLPHVQIYICRFLSIIAFTIIHLLVLRQLLSKHFIFWFVSWILLTLFFSLIPVLITIVGWSVGIGCGILFLMGAAFGILFIGGLLYYNHVIRKEKELHAIPLSEAS